ncbi:MAG: PDZ domain-containing protein, partial [Muribaculaceae bacterium]|nr:PDZ domain-containing protein [Muribaculaceae bacterium]
PGKHRHHPPRHTRIAWSRNGRCDEALLKSLGLSHGVSVKSVSSDGRFAEAGMKKNYVILMINGQRIDSAESVNKLYKAIRQSDSRDKVMFISGVYPDGQQAYYAVPLND